MTLKKVAMAALMLVVNLVYFALVCYGCAGHLWAWRIFQFCTWLFNIALTMLAVNKYSQYGTKRTVPERKLPAYITVGFDVATTIVIVGYGHWFYGIMVIIQMVLEQDAFAPKLEGKVPVQP